MMAIVLFDTNFLFALGWANHEHHQVAHRYFSTLAGTSWATCPMTQCGFVRISSNRKAISWVTRPAVALDLLAHLTRDAGHVFWKDDLSLLKTPLRTAAIQGHRQVTDAYLLSLAMKNGGQLVTFDQGIPSLASTDAERASIILLKT